MIAYVVRRVAMMVPVMLGASVLAFLLVDMSGDPVQARVFQLEQQNRGEPVAPEVIENLEQRLYHDRTSPERYWLWLTGLGENNGDIGLLKGKWGPSIEGRAIDVGDEIGKRFWVTLRLVLLATLASVGIAILSGVISAVKQYSVFDHGLTFIGFLCLALPTFWFAVLTKEAGLYINNFISWFVQLFGADRWRPLKTYGDSTVGFSGGTWATVADVLPHLILPTLVLMLTGYASMSRYQRASMLEVLNSDYVRLARAKGVRNWTVMRRHALRTALIPVATFAPLAVAGAMGGSLVVEIVFGWKGLGEYAYLAIRASDAYPVMAYLLISGVLTLIGVLISDLLYGVLDPRIRHD